MRKGRSIIGMTLGAWIAAASLPVSASGDILALPSSAAAEGKPQTLIVLNKDHEKGGVVIFFDRPSTLSHEPSSYSIDDWAARQGGKRSRPKSNGDEYKAHILAASSLHGVDPALIRAIIHAESSFNPFAVSPKGAAGLMQLMPETARRMGVSDRFDPVQNVHGGTRYLKKLLTMFNGDLVRAVAAYNAGEDAVLRHGGVPPYSETQAYVPRVLSLYRKYQKEFQS